MEPGGALGEGLGGRGQGRERRLETLRQVGETRVIALGEHVETQTGTVGEPLGGLQAGQTNGRPAFEREQGTRMAHALGDDLLGGRRRPRRAGRGLWAWAGRNRGLYDRAGPQAGHGQDPRLAGEPLGFLAEHGAHLLAHGGAPCPLQGRIGCGERLGQMPPRVGLAELRTAAWYNCGDGWYSPCLFLTEHGQNRPFQLP